MQLHSSSPSGRSATPTAHAMARSMAGANAAPGAFGAGAAEVPGAGVFAALLAGLEDLAQGGAGADAAALRQEADAGGAGGTPVEATPTQYPLATEAGLATQRPDRDAERALGHDTTAADAAACLAWAQMMGLSPGAEARTAAPVSTGTALVADAAAAEAASGREGTAALDAGDAAEAGEARTRAARGDGAADHGRGQAVDAAEAAWRAGEFPMTGPAARPDTPTAPTRAEAQRAAEGRPGPVEITARGIDAPDARGMAHHQSGIQADERPSTRSTAAVDVAPAPTRSEPTPAAPAASTGLAATHRSDLAPARSNALTGSAARDATAALSRGMPSDERTAPSALTPPTDTQGNGFGSSLAAGSAGSAGAWGGALAAAAGPGATGATGAGSREPAVLEMQLSTPVDHEDFPIALGLQVSALVREGVQEARVQLNPVELGPISVEIALDGREAQVHFAAEQAHARDALRDSLDTLARALQADGFTLAGGSVGEGRAQAGGERQREGASDAATRGVRRAALQALGATEAPEAARAALARSASASGGVDLYA